MLRRIAYIVPVFLFSILALLTITPATAVSDSPAVITPPAATTPALPACEYEDGSGQALCYWDAQTSGNGEGTSLISGDCAPDYIGGQANSDLCVALFNKGQEGIDWVGECVGTENTISDSDRKNEGWNIEECFKAFE